MFKCNFPKCEYTTENKSKIDRHHIIPKEVQKRKGIKNNVLIPLCPNHHKMIFHPESKFGQHSIKCKTSIHIINILKSTTGQSIQYLDYFDNKEKFYFPSTGEIWD